MASSDKKFFIKSMESREKVGLKAMIKDYHSVRSLTLTNTH